MSLLTALKDPPAAASARISATCRASTAWWSGVDPSPALAFGLAPAARSNWSASSVSRLPGSRYTGGPVREYPGPPCTGAPLPPFMAATTAVFPAFAFPPGPAFLPSFGLISGGLQSSCGRPRSKACYAAPTATSPSHDSRLKDQKGRTNKARLATQLIQLQTVQKPSLQDFPAATGIRTRARAAWP